MMPNFDPKQMQAIMKKMGIKSTTIDATEVTIKTNSGEIKIEQPQVTCVEMQGQKTFQIAGKISEAQENAVSEDDIKIVMEKTGNTKEKAKEALEESNGDIAEAIIKLQD